MSQPFSGMPSSGTPNPETPRPFKRRSQPAVVQEAMEMLRAARARMQPMLQSARRAGREAFWQAQRQGQNLWYRGKRNPRTVGLIAGALVLTLGGAYALSASSAGRSMCPTSGKTGFVLLMDPVPSAVARSELEIRYDVCGLASGAPYRAKVRLTQPQVAGQKKKKLSDKPKLVVTFQGKADGPATRRHQPVNLGSLRPGPYTLELLVVDGKGRQRRSQQKVLLQQ